MTARIRIGTIKGTRGRHPRRIQTARHMPHTNSPSRYGGNENSNQFVVSPANRVTMLPAAIHSMPIVIPSHAWVPFMRLTGLMSNGNNA
jgi:hypothetical protein